MTHYNPTQTPKETLLHSPKMPQIIDEYLNGVSMRAIAKRHKVSRHSLRQALTMAGIVISKGSNQKYKIEDLDRAAEEYANGTESLSAVAKRYPFSYQTLYNHIVAKYGEDYKTLVDKKRGKKPGTDANSEGYIRNTEAILEEVRQHGCQSFQELLNVSSFSQTALRDRYQRGLIDLPNTICDVCGSPIYVGYGTKYCSTECEVTARKCRIYETDQEALNALPDYCEMCGSTDKLVIDHDHATGGIRGTLCNKCNTAIGLLRDDVTILAAGIAYLS